MLTDTHCHLDFTNFNNDRKAIIARAINAGVHRVLNPGINLNSSRKAVEISQDIPQVFAAVGVHPNDAVSWDATTFNALRELAKQPKVVAIGEIGLDYYRDRSPHDLQMQVFREQLRLAGEANLPIIIHTRNSSPTDLRAVEETLLVLENWIGDLKRRASGLADHPGVLHSFSSDYSTANKAIEIGLMIGITGPVTYKKANGLREVAANIDLDHLLIETDAPFLTPQQHRGKRNEPAHVKYVADKIAEIRNISYDVIVQKTWLNSERIFNW